MSLAVARTDSRCPRQRAERYTRSDHSAAYCRAMRGAVTEKPCSFASASVFEENPMSVLYIVFGVVSLALLVYLLVALLRPESLS